MSRLTESASGLVISSPVWLGILVLGMGIALAVYVVRGKVAAGRRFGAAIGALVTIYVGVHFLGNRTTLDDVGVRVVSPMKPTESIAWSEVASVAVEQRSTGKGGPSRFIVLRSTHHEVAVRISSLPLADAGRVVNFVREKAGRRSLPL